MHEEALKHLGRADDVLGKLIHRVGPCDIKATPRRSPFQALVQSVAHQQLNGKAAATILGRVKGLFPGKVFPTPQDLMDMPEERLRGAGLSRSKIAAIKDIARHSLSGKVPDNRSIAKLTDEEILERLTAIRGVGPWTVHMLLMFKLGRLDVLPATDFGVRKGFSVVYAWEEMPSPAELLEHGERWRPYRSIASWYMWRALELPS